MNPPSVVRSVVHGALGFAGVSVAAFSVWAFGAPWFRQRLGEVGLYAGVALAFLVLTGIVLYPLAGGLSRFYKTFVPAFLAYAVVWSAIWFATPSRLGEGLASLAGTATFALVAGLLHGRLKAWPRVAAVLFVAHSVGYFLGGVWYVWCKQPQGMELLGGFARNAGRLGWGLLYGLGFGAGLGYTFASLRRDASTVQQ